MGHEKQSYSFQEACETLGLSAQMLRRVLREYSDLLNYSDQESEASSRYLSSEAVSVAGVILALSSQGLSKEQITERVALRRVSGGTSLEASALDTLLSKIEQVQKDLADSEKRRAEDRDRLFTALARTQQELQRLKNEFSIAASRKNRNPSLLKRLLS